MNRISKLDKEESKQKADLDFQQKVENDRVEIECKTEKKRKKRQREKELKIQKKMLKKNGVSCDSLKSASPKEIRKSGEENETKEEFFYKPLFSEVKNDESKTSKDPFAIHNDETLSKLPQLVEMTNDGNFLERMKRHINENTNQSQTVEQGTVPAT
uniref:Uncharacterized protein n=1 Tax=Proboscia inermis TaxID=420281 RepID=A0A7S0BWF3_9STRA|mmetsp:Transcript_11041/g.11148  ORF Transcript_11041/g.11148 Transcript_11041/m.11148 type:complete len:157 (+) Transcript_11041:164-634(+)